MSRALSPLSRDELVDLFWQSEAPEALATFCSLYRCHFHRLEPIGILTEPYDDLDPRGIDRAESVTFTLSGQPFGEWLYLAVICNDHVIVPPFPIDQRETLPTMKEASRAPATRRPTVTA